MHQIDRKLEHIEYKVKWENKDLNTYLSFYSCSGSLCTTSDNVSNYYSRVVCEKKKCPYIRERQGNLVILATAEKDYVYNFITGNVVSDTYTKYTFANDYIIVKNSDNKYGVIDENNEIIVKLEYNKIVDYNDGFLAYSENSKVGIINSEKSIDVKPNYETVILIDQEKYAYLEDGKYYIASYVTELPMNDTTYDYLYSTGGITFVVKDKKIDILDTNLNSQLLLKIDTDYSYTKEKERASLDLYREGNLLHFRVINDNEITNYIFDIKNKKLFY